MSPATEESDLKTVLRENSNLLMTVEKLRGLLQEQSARTAAAERKLIDYYAGQALLACCDEPSDYKIARKAWSIAEKMIQERRDRIKPQPRTP